MIDRRMSNGIHSIITNGVRVKGVLGVMYGMFNHFKSVNLVRSGVTDFQFNTLIGSKETQLVSFFFSKGVSEKSCGGCYSFKNSSPNEVNFGFIRFLLNLKLYLIIILDKFFSN